jgi:hypothetical protein
MIVWAGPVILFTVLLLVNFFDSLCDDACASVVNKLIWLLLTYLPFYSNQVALK